LLKTAQKRLQKLRMGWFLHTKTRTKNIAKTCRYFGISRQTYYKWLKRFEESGKNGLVDRNKKPLSPPPGLWIQKRGEPSKNYA
jgi:transposase-like protein